MYRILFLSAVALCAPSAFADPLPVQTVTASLTSLPVEVALAGTLQAVNSFPVAFPQGGRVISVAVAILSFIMLYIIPKFEKIFRDFGMKLPDLTQFLMNTSQWFGKYWYILPLFPIGFVLTIRLLRLNKSAGYVLDRMMLYIPIIGTLIEKTTVARTMRTLGTLISSGVPILEALAIVRETCTNQVFERMYQRVYESIREGDTIVQPLRESKMVDDIVTNMIDVGEETGDLDTMLYKISDIYDEEVNVVVESLLSLLEPIMIVVLGGIVGTIVIALFMPMLSLLDKLSG